MCLLHEIRSGRLIVTFAIWFSVTSTKIEVDILSILNLIYPRFRKSGQNFRNFLWKLFILYSFDLFLRILNWVIQNELSGYLMNIMIFKPYGPLDTSFIIYNIIFTTYSNHLRQFKRSKFKFKYMFNLYGRQ